MNQNSQSQVSQNDEENIQVNKNIVVKRRGRRKGKGTKVEFPEVASETSNVSSPSSERSLAFPSRPGYGKLGTKCVVKTNHFIAEVSEKDLSQYNVSCYFDP